MKRFQNDYSKHVITRIAVLHKHNLDIDSIASYLEKNLNNINAHAFYMYFAILEIRRRYWMHTHNHRTTYDNKNRQSTFED